MSCFSLSFAQEWFNFVDREKQLRMNIAAQVTQLVEDATNLKSWTVSQVVAPVYVAVHLLLGLEIGHALNNEFDEKQFLDMERIFSQVDTIRGEMDEEITLLLDTIQCKSKKLEDTMARLTARLRWGIAVLQTKNELRVKRQIFNIWRYDLHHNQNRLLPFLLLNSYCFPMYKQGLCSQ